MFRPKENLAAHTIHLPMPPRLSPYLPPILEFLYIYGACEILENVRWSHTKAPDAMIGGTAQTFPKVSCLAHKFSLQGVKHFKRSGFADLVTREKRKDLYLSSNYPLLIICLPNISDGQSYKSDICQNELVRVGFPTQGKG